MTAKLRGGEAGVTLIEAMIMASVLALVVYATYSLLSNASAFNSKEGQKLTARHILDRAIADVNSSAGFYPPMASGAQAVSYVTCYGKQGQAMSNSLGKPGIVAAPLTDPTMPSSYCPGARYEAHVTPATDGSRTAQVLVILMPAGVKAMDYRATINLESTL